MTLSSRDATFADVHVTSLDGEPIATIPRVELTYDLHDLLPGGHRLFGLESLTISFPRITIVRHRNGSFNVPVPSLPANRGGQQTPLIARVTVRDGSIDVVNQSPNVAENQRRLYMRNVDVNADISSAARSHYRIALRYGERPDSLYPVRGRGDIDPKAGYITQLWTAPAVPIAAAANFVVNAPSLRVDSGTLRNVEARYFAVSEASGALRTHLAASAQLTQGRLSIAGLAAPVDGVRGPVDVYDDGLLTPALTAAVAGVPVRVTGGIYDLHDPHLRVAIRGAGDLTQLRSAFAQARRLPMRGPLAFSLLVEGRAGAPLVWIDLRSAGITYAATTLDRLGGLAAFDGREVDVVNFTGNYGRVPLATRGSIALRPQRNAIEMLVGIRAPAGAVPYAGAIAPDLPIDAEALATADDPKAIAVRGVLFGSSPRAALAGIFDVDSRGNGEIGPLRVRDGNGSAYARIALDPVHGSAGLATVHDFPLPGQQGTVDVAVFGGKSGAAIGADGLVRVAAPWGAATARTRVTLRRGAIRGTVFGGIGDEARFGASLAGTTASPRAVGTVVVAGGRYRHFSVNGNAELAFAGGTLEVRDAAAVVGPLFVAAAGTVTNLQPQGTFAPRYDLTTQLHSSDVRALLAVVRPDAAALVQGSIDADLRVWGSGLVPSFAGTMNAPEGSVNGLSFRDFSGALQGDRGALSLTGARVVVGSTAVAFDAAATSSLSTFNVRAPHADLADFNDFFDEGDTFAGTGSLALTARARGMQVVATDGEARFTGARFRQIALGNVAAHWRDEGGAVATTLRFGGPSGIVNVAGSVTPASKSVNLRAQAAEIDLGTWLPMLGFDLPITGRLDAQTSIAGRYPDVALNLRAAIFHGTAGRLPIERFDLVASAAHGRGTIQAATLELPSLSAAASGTFGVRANDPLALQARITSPDVGAFLDRAAGKDVGVAGTLDSTLRLDGTRADPQLQDAFTLQSLRRGNLTIPMLRGVIAANRRTLVLRDGEIDLARGKALLSAAVPMRKGPLSASLVADDIELSNFAALLPKGTQLRGRIDGRVIAGGTLDAPLLDGSLALRDGTFSGRIEKTPISGIAGELAFAGTRATLQAGASAGGGSLTASGSARLPNLRAPAAAALSVAVRAEHARLDIPAYFNGELNGAVTLARAAGEIPSLGGDVAISRARIPLDAFMSRRSGTGSGSGFDIAFANLHVAATDDVRVQSANVDIGASGNLTLAGSLAAPSLEGSFRSTGGTLSFYRTFNVQNGSVTFSRSSGLAPDVNAVATTFVADPSTAISLHVTGPVTNMNLAFASDPSYSRQQILGLLVGAQQFGAVQGVRGSGGQGFSAGSAAQQLAFGQVNTLFTRNMLEPLSSSVAGALGFSDAQITTDLQTGLGVNAVKAFGKNVNAIFAQTFGYPRTQSVTLDAHPNVATSLRLSAYTTSGPTLFALQQPQAAGTGVLQLNPYTVLPPANGANGVTFSYVKRFP